MKHGVLITLGLAGLLLGWHRPAAADLVLSFDQSSYTVGVGETVAVKVFLSQNSSTNDPQISSTLLLNVATIEVSTNPSNAAAVVHATDIAFGPSFGTLLSSTSLMSTEAIVLDNTFPGLGLSSLSPPVLLGTFTFTGLQGGITTIQVQAVPNGQSFHANPSVAGFQPGATATATIATVPEPHSVVTFLTGGPLLLGLLAWRRSRG